MLGSLLKGLMPRKAEADRNESRMSLLGGGTEGDLHKALVSFLHDAPKPIKVIDYELVAYLRASVEAADYMTTRMSSATNYRQRDALLISALEQCEIPGLMLEFGVFKGHSLRFIASRTSATVHGFDSFQGLPDDWTHFQKKGRFDLGGQVPAFEERNVQIHEGWFSDTVPSFLARETGPIRFLHLDCDLYSSTKEVLDGLSPRIVSGTVIVLDDYLNYPAWREHQYRAFQEFVSRQALSYRYLGFASSYTAVTVRID